MTHSPTPWRQDDNRILDAFDGLVAVDDGYDDFFDGTNIPLIVRAVNSQAALVAALESANKFIKEHHNSYREHDVLAVQIEISDALSLARGHK